MPTFKRLHLFDYSLLFLTGLALSSLTGGLLNAINGCLSPAYFYWIFYFNFGTDYGAGWNLWRHTVLEGLREGLFFGCIMSGVFTAWTFLVSRSACPLKFALRYVTKMLAVVTTCWLVGGVNGMLLGTVRHGIVSQFGMSSAEKTRFLFVGGSIWGLYGGCALALVLGCAWFARDWDRARYAE